VHCCIGGVLLMRLHALVPDGRDVPRPLRPCRTLALLYGLCLDGEVLMYDVLQLHDANACYAGWLRVPGPGSDALQMRADGAHSRRGCCSAAAPAHTPRCSGMRRREPQHPRLFVSCAMLRGWTRQGDGLVPGCRENRALMSGMGAVLCPMYFISLAVALPGPCG
jgi:hypothetical protein